MAHTPSSSCCPHVQKYVLPPLPPAFGRRFYSGAGKKEKEIPPRRGGEAPPPTVDTYYRYLGTCTMYQRLPSTMCAPELHTYMRTSLTQKPCSHSTGPTALWRYAWRALRRSRDWTLASRITATQQLVEPRSRRCCGAAAGAVLDAVLPVLDAPAPAALLPIAPPAVVLPPDGHASGVLGPPHGVRACRPSWTPRSAAYCMTTCASSPRASVYIWLTRDDR